MKYIPADKLYDYLGQVSELYPRYADDIVDNAVSNVIDGIKTFITSLQQEQPEVDLEKAYKPYMESKKDDLSGNAVTVNMKDLARHFYELGLNARKEK